MLNGTVQLRQGLQTATICNFAVKIIVNNLLAWWFTPK